MKKFLAILMTAMMLLAMTAAFAESNAVKTFTITYPTENINTAVEHTYEIYQIFKGDIAKDSKGATILSNVVWGANASSGYTPDAPVTEDVLKAIMAISGTDQQKLEKIKTYVDLNGNPAYQLTKDPGSVEVVAGYYLIKDKDASQNDKHDAYTTYIVAVLNELQIKPKAVYPTVDKEVLDETSDAEANAQGGWGESADHEINESFQFRLTATLPGSEKYADYKTYAVTFVDTMSAGITFESIESVTVDGQPVTDYTCSATAGQAGGEWTLGIADLKAIDGVNLTNGADIVVVYNAHLNENAVAYNANSTTCANKNTVKLQYSNNPNGTGEGVTSEDHVFVFTYVVNNTKFANEATDANVLPGAGFELYAGDALVKLIDKGNGKYVVADQTLTEGFVTEMFAGADGKFYITGLDDGSYVLKEKTVPAGYNKMEDYTIIVDATHFENDAETDATLNLADNSKMNNDLINKSGATLPETGGIGTTLFYLLGGLMTVGSALILVVRRRAESEEE